MYLVDQPPNSIFTEPELARLAVYRAAVAAGFYTDWDGSDATAETELARLTNGDHTRAAPAADEPGGDAAPEAL